MVLARHLSLKKTRFSAKKIAFLELQRFQRLEYGRALTRRKRLERVLFLPEVKDEVGELSSESVQRILCQGSPFHFSKALVKERSDSLHSLLFDDLVSVKRLGAHDLVVLLSLLLKLSVDNYSLLSKTLEECVSRFNVLTLDEVAHIAFHICDLPECLKSTFIQKWMPKVASLLHRLDLNKFSDNDFSTLAKLAYSLSHNASHERSLLLEVISCFPLGNGGDGHIFSRDCGLVCKSMLKSGIVNYNFFRAASEFYDSCLRQNVDQLRAISTIYRKNVIFSLNDKVETLVCVDDLLLLLEACEHFGYHNKSLLEAFNRYVEYSLDYFVSSPRCAEHYRQRSTPVHNRVTQKYAELLRSQRYKHAGTGKHDLPRLLADLLSCVTCERQPFWKIDAIYAIGSKYVSSRKSFARFLHLILCSIRLDMVTGPERTMLQELCWSYMMFHSKLLFHVSDTETISSSDPYMKSSNEDSSYNQAYEVVPFCASDSGLYGPRFDLLYKVFLKEGNERNLHAITEMFRAIVSQMPVISCWKSVWQMLHIIEISKSVDMLPLVRSFLEESFLGFHPLEEPISHACSIMAFVVQNRDALIDAILYLDSCVRIVELLSTSEISCDYGSLSIFGNIFELFVTVKRTLWDATGMNEDIRSIIEQLASTLLDYLMEFSRVKHDVFSLPVPHSVYQQVTKGVARYISAHDLIDPISTDLLLEHLREASQTDSDMFLQTNTDLIRHIVLNGNMSPN